MNTSNLAYGIPVAVTAAALYFGFNHKLAGWASNMREHRNSKDNLRIRAAQTRQHGLLLASGTIGVALGIPLARVASIGPVGRIAFLGVAGGGALTVVAAVIGEWEHYNEGQKVLITGGTLAGLLGAAIVMS
jgi:hypothetical protein